jgi:DNA-binding transcriptional ArsR family regulator
MNRENNIVGLVKSCPEQVFSALNHCQGAVSWVDSNQRLLMANRRYVEDFGYRSLEHLIGTTYDMQPSEGAELCDAWITQEKLTMRRGKETQILTYVHNAHSSERKVIWGMRTPASDELGSVIGVTNQFLYLDRGPLVLPLFEHMRGERHSLFHSTKRGAFSVVLGDYERVGGVELTTRQSECLFFVLRRFSARDTADWLGLSVRTVETHLDRLKGAFLVDSLSELFDKALGMGYANVIPSSIVSDLGRGPVS